VGDFRFRPARAGTIAIFMLAGLLFWTSSSVSQGSNIRTDDSLLQMSDLIRDRGRENARLEASTAELRAEVQRLREGNNAGDPSAQQRIGELEQHAGLNELEGEGLTVTLTDAPPDATALLPDVRDPRPDDLVIHQQDLQAVVNALWAGGAEGIQVMDQRLISTSAVRCVGNTLILQGQLYSPPYVVTAVGDPDRLREALDTSPAIQLYQLYVDAYGLGWELDRHSSVTLPGYTGSVELQHALPEDGRDEDRSGDGGHGNE
jgi:uncharacterized protein YlxW (UPF0749 family)